MARRSGYEVTIKAFLPANANDPDSMVEAAKVIRGAVVAMSEAGFREVEARPRYRTRAEVADEPAPTAASNDAPEPRDPIPMGGQHIVVQPSNRDPEQPAELRRGTKAGG